MANVSASVDQTIRALERRLPDDIVRPARLYPLRESVEKANTAELNRLHTPPFAYPAIDHGPAKNYLTLLDSSPAVPLLHLKVGAQVMLLKNYDDGLANGTLGTVEAFSTLSAFRRQISPSLIGEENQSPSEAEEGDLPSPSSITRDTIGRPSNKRDSNEAFPVVVFPTEGPSDSRVVRRVLVMRDEFKIDGADGQQMARRVQVWCP